MSERTENTRGVYGKCKEGEFGYSFSEIDLDATSPTGIHWEKRSDQKATGDRWMVWSGGDERGGGMGQEGVAASVCDVGGGGRVQVSSR